MSLAYKAPARVRIPSDTAKRLRVDIQRVLQKDQSLTENERELLSQYAHHRVDSIAAWRHDRRSKAFETAIGDVLTQICCMEREGRLDPAFQVIEDAVHRAVMERRTGNLSFSHRETRR